MGWLALFRIFSDALNNSVHVHVHVCACVDKVKGDEKILSSGRLLQTEFKRDGNT